MYNVTQNFLNAIKQNGRTFKSSVTVRGTVFDDNNIIDLDLEENVNPTDSFMLGGVGSSKLEVTLINVPDNLILSNASVTATISLNTGSSFEDVPLGVFTVDEVDKDKNTVKLTNYDNMILLEQAYFSDLTYPTDINNVANEICTKAGVQLASALPHVQINEIDGYTYREAVSFIASFLGGFARFNRTGKLEILSYADSGFSITADNYFSLKTNDKLYSIGKLTCKVGDKIISSGSNGNEVQFENPIMTQAQLDSIYNILKNLSYMPYSMDWQGNMALQAGDKINITDLKGNTYNTLLMDNKITYSGGLSGSASAVGKTETGQNFSSSGTLSNSVDRLVTEQANIKVLLADKATIEDLTATNGRIDNLSSAYATIVNLTATNVRIDNLSSTYATITQLNAVNANINSLTSAKANVTDLTAATGRITTLESTTASIQNVLAGNVGANNLAAGAIQAGSAVIAIGAIGSAQISNLVVDKLTGGILDLSKGITIAGANNRLKISGNRLQVFAAKADNSLYERVSLGDVNGDGSVFGFRVRGADGTTILYDETGVKREGVTDGSINNAKIGADANISGTKLDINSVVATINNTATTTILSSKIFVNNSTLDVQFTSLSNTVTSQGNTISSQGSQITSLSNSITLKVNTSDFTSYQTTVSSSLNSKANQSSLDTTNSNVTALTTRMSTAESSISVLQNQIILKVSQTDIDNSINSIQVGGRNLILNGDFSQGVIRGSGTAPTNWNFFGARTVVFSGQGNTGYNSPRTLYIGHDTVDSGIKQNLNLSKSTQYTMSFTLAKENVSNVYTNISYYDSSNNVLATIVFSYDFSKSGKQSFTFTTPSTFDHCIFAHGATAVNYANGFLTYFGNVKLELGNKTTDWSPAPEDVQSQIDTTNTNLNTANSNITSLSSRMTSAESSITTLSNSITLKVNTSDFTSYQTTVTNNFNTTNTNVTALTTRMSTAESSINVLQGQITTKVTQTDIDNSINSIQIGGRNLIKNSCFAGGLTSYWYTNGSGWSTITDSASPTGYCVNITAVNGGYWYSYGNTTVAMVIGQQYTISLKAKGTGSLYYGWEGGRATINVTSSYVQYSYTFTYTGNNNFSFYGNSSGCNISMHSIKLEVGSKSTDWTPAPEDVDASISSAQSNAISTANSYTNGQISSVNTSISSLTTRVSTAEQKLLPDAIVSTVSQSIVSQSSTSYSVKNSDAGITYYVSSNWYSETISGAYSGRGVYCNVPNAYIQYTFVGTGCNIYDCGSVNMGMSQVFLDGVSQGTFDGYASSPTFRRKMFSVNNLTYGSHVIKIVVTGTKNSSAANCYYELDYFEVLNNQANVTSSSFGSTLRQSSSDFLFAFNQLNSAKVQIDPAGLHVTGGSIDGTTITSNVGTSKTVVDGGALTTYYNNSQALKIHDTGMELYDPRYTGFLAGGFRSIIGSTFDHRGVEMYTSSTSIQVNRIDSGDGYRNTAIDIYFPSKDSACVVTVGGVFNVQNNFSMAAEGIINGIHFQGGNELNPSQGTNIWVCYQSGDGLSVGNGTKGGYGTLHCGDFYSHGSKNRLVKTQDYGYRALSAYETADSLFGDIGRAKLVNGLCVINLDPIFLQTINTNVPYEVKTWAYGKGCVWVQTNEMFPNYFIVRGDNDIEFGYEIIAKQKGYETNRLKLVDMSN
ncbi:MAG: hypothetical protein Q8936_08375 [Bacillota bacterium]|nr:hypothetical protein [Bacillota bacterium]